MFKSNNQRKFLYSLDKDKQKGLNPGTGQAIPMNPLQPSPMVPPINPIKMPVSNVPKLNNPQLNQGSGVIPAEPGLKKLPRFGKMKNSLKGQLKGIK